jgi:hypothetical protein
VISARLSWMYRGNEGYDPNELGSLTQAKVATALIEAGKIVLLPWMQVARYDLIIDDDGVLSRVQCKTGQLSNGAIYFRPHSLRAAKKETGWVRVISDYRGAIDFFGVYCPDNQKVYLIPIKDVTTTGGCYLRLDPPKNNQRKRIRWAKDYEVKPRHRQPNLFDSLDLGP